MASRIVLTAMSSSRSTLGRDLLLIGAYNTGIALFLAAVTRYSFTLSMLYAQCIGLGIFCAVHGSRLLRKQPRIEWLDGLVGIPIGFVSGFAIATWIDGVTLHFILTEHPDSVIAAGATAIIFGILGTWHFRNEARLHEARVEAEAERLRRIEQEAFAAHTQLTLLQAQIEPHFLFNTLSNVVGLIDTDAAAARQMLLDLTTLLRTSLARTRQPVVTLAEELDLLRAYLGIMGVRMATRLEWRIDAPPDTLAAHLPPLLVQPLVENAIHHGLEPKATGGQLTIRCRRLNDMLEIEVGDNGQGFSGNRGDGTGLTNVRKRLTATCGSAATLTLAAGEAGGTVARLRLPYRDHEPGSALTPNR